MLARLKIELPDRWFPDVTPVLDALLSGLAAAWVIIYGQLQYTLKQTRIATATDTWLDLIAADFFGPALMRKATEGDVQFSARIRAALLQPKGTRAAIIANLTALTGRVPDVFEPSLASDTGGYGSTGMTVGTGLAYNAAGGYGSLALPFQGFITAYRHVGGGVANVAGYYLGSGWAGGGYGVGAIEYASPSMVRAAITDTDMLNTVNTTRPAATIAWINIVGGSGGVQPLGVFILGRDILA